MDGAKPAAETPELDGSPIELVGRRPVWLEAEP